MRLQACSTTPSQPPFLFNTQDIAPKGIFPQVEGHAYEKAGWISTSPARPFPTCPLGVH
ncbi:hypothetical protein AAY473_002158 [Plecturocebus cupreus]